MAGQNVPRREERKMEEDEDLRRQSSSSSDSDSDDDYDRRRRRRVIPLYYQTNCKSSGKSINFELSIHLFKPSWLLNNIYCN